MLNTFFPFNIRSSASKCIRGKSQKLCEFSLWRAAKRYPEHWVVTAFNLFVKRTRRIDIKSWKVYGLYYNTTHSPTHQPVTNRDKCCKHELTFPSSNFTHCLTPFNSTRKYQDMQEQFTLIGASLLVYTYTPWVTHPHNLRETFCCTRIKSSNWSERSLCAAHGHYFR